MSPPLGIPAMGLVTPLGYGKTATVGRLFRGCRDGLVPDDTMITGKSVPIGRVTGKLPEIPPELSDIDCRNNRLMLTALNEISSDIAAVVDRYGRDRVAVVLGTSTAGIAEGEAAWAAFVRDGVWPPGYRYSRQETGNLADFAARVLGLTGPAYTVATACSSSGKAFASARRLIMSGLCDAAVVGGADSLCRLTLNGFHSLEAISSRPCNPFSANRDGINIGEGAAAFLLVRDVSPVMLLGIGECSGAHHVSAPDPSGHGAEYAMRLALNDGGLTACDIGYVNLHGTATALNDAMESKAMAAVFPPGTPCSSTKAMTGHLLGAAGACEAAFLWLTLHPAFNEAGLLPPHLWDGVADPALPSLALVAPGTIFLKHSQRAML
ncbi:MAG: beta-ketoacyl-[acyl-carrier-protein] synthase family protein, partial [Rhodospirillaceae bacterium]